MRALMGTLVVLGMLLAACSDNVPTQSGTPVPMPSTETERPTAAIATQGADKTVSEATEAMTPEDLDDVEGSVSRLDSGPESSVESNDPMEEDQEEVMTEEEALEADLREWAKAEGISYEEALWRYEWRDAFRPVLKGIRENYPKDFSWFRFSRDSRAAVIGFHGEVPPDVQVILDEFSEAHEVEFVVNTQAGYNETDLSEAIPRVHYALFCTEGVTDAGTNADGEIIGSTVALSSDAPSVDDLTRIAQDALESGAHEGLAVSVEVWPSERGPMGYPTPDANLREKACAEYLGGR